MEAVTTQPMPRSVFIADDREYHRIGADPKTVGLLQETDSMIMPVTADPEVNRDHVLFVRQAISSAGQLVPGALLVKNPYDSTSYEFAEYAVEAFASAKYHALANVARLLGARSVSFLEVKVEQKDATWAAELRAKLSMGGGEAATRHEIKKRVEDSLQGQMKFVGAEPDAPAAIAYLASHRLVADHQLNALIEMRTGDNAMSTYQMVFNGVKEADANFRSAISLANSGPVKAVEVGGTFTRTVSSVSRIEIKIEIEF